MTQTAFVREYLLTLCEEDRMIILCAGFSDNVDAAVHETYIKGLRGLLSTCQNAKPKYFYLIESDARKLFVSTNLLARRGYKVISTVRDVGQPYSQLIVTMEKQDGQEAPDSSSKEEPTAPQGQSSNASGS